jgi:hypothetical protein
MHASRHCETRTNLRVKKGKDEAMIICLSNFVFMRWSGLKSRIFITAGQRPADREIGSLSA